MTIQNTMINIKAMDIQTMDLKIMFIESLQDVGLTLPYVLGKARTIQLMPVLVDIFEYICTHI
jgi:hypothetical protein